MRRHAARGNGGMDDAAACGKGKGADKGKGKGKNGGAAGRFAPYHTLHATGFAGKGKKGKGKDKGVDDDGDGN